MRKRTFLPLIVTAILAALIFLQIHAWRKFNWKEFWNQTKAVHWWLVVFAVLLVHAADALRGLRWAVLLRPMRQVNPISLVGPQFVGFSGLALLGRAGELIRPYIIGRRTELTMSSQMAIWTVERLFDMGAVALLLGLSLFSGALRSYENYSTVRVIGLLAIVSIALLIIGAFLLWRNGQAVSEWVKNGFLSRFPSVAHGLSRRISTFSQSLHTIRDARSFIIVTLLSFAIWMMVAGSYRLVTNAYQQPLSDFGFAEVVLLMFASIAGGIAQLPAIGGGSQLATIGTLTNFFGINAELSTSCGILLWLVTFMSVVPLGLVLAHREHVSLRQLVKEEEQAEIRAVG